MDGQLHSLLRRQLKRHLSDPDRIPAEWQPLVDAVNQAYRQADLDRLMIERSLELSSDELSAANQRMRVAVAGLQQARAELEARVAERTHELTEANASLQRAIDEQRRLEDQLRQAMKMEAIGRLAGGVAHDFNNLLVVILGQAELLLDTDLTPQAASGVREILSAADSAAGLTRQLLAFSRRQTLNPIVIEVNELVESTTTMVSRLIGEDITFSVTLDAGVGSVSADPSQLQQVILNLAANARDAMPDGGTLRISTAAVEVTGEQAGDPPLPAGPYVLLTVSDSGVGMDAAVRAHIFEPFFTTKGHRHGTGLGLSTAYGIIKQSHGHIDVSSEPGHGATFRVWLPRVAAAPALEAPDQPHAQPLESGVVLVVEDQQPVRRSIRARLELAGFTVVDCPDGQTALTIAETLPRLDLLLTDMVMPGMSGRELAERLEQGRPDLKVLYMTGYVNDVVVAEEVAQGRRQILQKPFRAEKLLQSVRAALGVQEPS